MNTIHKILLATDFSEHSQLALLYATELAKAFGAELVLCHIVDTPSMISQLPPSGEGYFSPAWSESQRELAKQQCEKLLAATGIARGHVRVEIGAPVTELIQVARDEQVDLLVTGTHGRGAIAHVLLGSVAENLVRKAPCPVLTVRRGQHAFVMP